MLLEEIYGKNEKEDTFSSRFEGIIQRAYQQTGKQVVVLIDEYDVPIQNGYTKGFYNDVIGFIKNPILKIFLIEKYRCVSNLCIKRQNRIRLDYFSIYS